jgi:hypothetical protein
VPSINKHKVGNSTERLGGDRGGKEGLKGCKEDFCNTVNELTMLARLHRALPRERKIKPRSLVAPSETYAIRRGNLTALSCYSLS